MTPLQTYLEATDKLFEKEFPIFKARNYTGDTIIGRTDKNGNVMPSDEIIRQQFNEKIKSFLQSRQIGLIELIKSLVPKDGENKHSVYTRCWDCLTWGISMPNDKICGDCGSKNTSEYYPDCREQFLKNLELRNN